MSQPPPKEDPWEARERQREQWRRASERRRGEPHRPSRRPGGDGSASLWEDATGAESGLREDYLVWGILATVGMLLFSEVPDISGHTREQIARAATLLLLLLLGSVRGLQENLRVAWRRGPNPAICLMVGWSIFEAIRAPYRSFAVDDLLRILDGVGVYFLCAYCLRATRQTGFVVMGLIAMGIFLSLEDIARTGQRGIGSVGLHESVFGTHENAGSLLVLLLPLALSFALSAGVEEKRRLAAAAASLILGVALLVARTRSAWVGGMVALTVLATLLYRFSDSRQETAGKSRSPGRSSRQSRRSTPMKILSSPATLIAAAMLLFLLIGGAAPWVLQRFVSLKSPLQDDSLSSRITMWTGAAQMASEKPVTGWGLGSFPIIQAYWTHEGVDEAEALQVGIGHDNIAHDYYVQTVADTGVIGLGLYIAVVVLFFLAAVRALPGVTAPPQRALLCGSIATVAGAMVDAIASPAYQFHGVWTVLWCVLGLGVAALRPLPSRAASSIPAPLTTSGLAPIPLYLYPLVALAAASVPLTIIGWGKAIIRHGTQTPRGRLELLVTPFLHHPAPGETIRWTAVFHDAVNHDRGTAAGTIWHPTVSAGGANQTALDHAKATLAESHETAQNARHGTYQLVAPILSPDVRGAPPQLTMHIRYQDNQGRWYSADSLIEVRVLKKAP